MVDDEDLADRRELIPSLTAFEEEHLMERCR
jgi:hypothetical protein